MRQRLSRIAGITVSVNDSAGGNQNKPIQVSLEGYNLDELQQVAQKAIAVIEKVPGVVDVDSSLSDQRPTLAVILHRDTANLLGITTTQIANTLFPLFGGEVVSSWRAPNDESYDVLVRLPRAAREHLSDVDNLLIPVPGGDGTVKSVPLRQVADIVQSSQPSQIDRRDLLRSVTIYGNVTGRAPGDVNAEINQRLTAMHLPEGYRFAFSGDQKNLNESAGYAGQALMMAVIFIYLVLASQFGSFLQPLAIMASLPLSLIGVFVGLLVTGSTLNVFSAIGFIMLMGLVTKNAILLVDFANHQRKEGKTLEEALMAAAQIRLRPIVMTTLAMIFGMIPLALGLGEGGEQRAPMAHAVIGGLISSTILTLVVVPVILTYLDRLGIFVLKYMPKAADMHAEGQLHPGE
jgi:HAE1 family hydrophobic/amphiphilic exporter-1